MPPLIEVFLSNPYTRPYSREHLQGNGRRRSKFLAVQAVLNWQARGGRRGASVGNVVVPLQRC